MSVIHNRTNAGTGGNPADLPRLEIQMARERYAGGESREEIAESLGRHRKTVWEWTRDMPAPSKKKPPTTQQQEAS